MTDVTKMSDEELLTWAQVCLDSDSTYEGMDLARELASRLEAALGREREDVEAFESIGRWNGIARKRLAAREKGER